MDEIVKEFLNESLQTAEMLERGVEQLEAQSADADVIKEVFRGVHTIKGSCGFLGFSKLEALTGSGELLLGRMQSGRVELTPEIATALVELVKRVREMLEGIREAGQEVGDEPGELIARLGKLAVMEGE